MSKRQATEKSRNTTGMKKTIPEFKSEAEEFKF